MPVLKNFLCCFPLLSAGPILGGITIFEALLMIVSFCIQITRSSNYGEKVILSLGIALGIIGCASAVLMIFGAIKVCTLGTRLSIEMPAE